MVYLRVKEILQEKGKTKYWLVKELGFNYKDTSNIVENETIAIKFSTIDKLCKILECKPGDLFKYE